MLSLAWLVSDECDAGAPPSCGFQGVLRVLASHSSLLLAVPVSLLTLGHQSEAQDALGNEDRGRDWTFHHVLLGCWEGGVRGPSTPASGGSHASQKHEKRGHWAGGFRAQGSPPFPLSCRMGLGSLWLCGWAGELGWALS